MGTNFEDLILRDTAANRPAAGKPGRLFYDTTNAKWQRDNGSTWDDCEPVSSGGVSFAKYGSQFATDTVNASGGSVDPLTIDTEYGDPDAIGSLSTNVVTLAGSGWYLITANFNIVFASAISANGSFLAEITFGGTGAPGDLYTRIPVLNGTNYTDGVITVTGLVQCTNASNTVSCAFTNGTNQNIDVTLYELSILKVG